MAVSDPAAAQRRKTWGWLALLLLVVVAVAFAAWWLIRSDTLRESEHNRNVHELDIVARNIESWPTSIDAMARGNLLPSRLTGVLPSEKDSGWFGAARFRHPQLGDIYITYGWPEPARGKPRECFDFAPPESRVAFAGRAMTVVGQIPLAELWYADRMATKTGSAIPVFSDSDAKRFANAINDAEGLRDAKGLWPSGIAAPPEADGAKAHPSICYRTSLPLNEVVDLAMTAPAIETLLLVDHHGNLLSQIGGEPLPMSGIDEIRALQPLFDTVIDAAAAAASNGKAPAGLSAKPPQVVDLDAPTEVSIGGRSYFAYARSLNLLPKTFVAAACGKAVKALPSDPIGPPPTPNAQPASTGKAAVDPTVGVVASAVGAAVGAAVSDALDGRATSDQGKGKSCLVMGLVPQAKVNAASARLSPAVLTAFGLVLGLLIALLPLLKLHLIGPADALRRIEIVAVAFGIVAAVAIATLTLLFAQAHIRDSNRAEQRARSLAAAMATDFGRELAAVLQAPIHVHGITGKDDAVLDPATVAKLTCRLPDGRDAKGEQTHDEQTTGPGFKRETDGGWWPTQESVAMFGEFGRAWPGFVPVNYRCDVGSRADISSRGYFKAAMSGQPGDGAVPLQQPINPKLLREVAPIGDYNVGAVRAVTDGIEKVIVVAPFRRVSQPEGPGPQRGVVLKTFVARSFNVPVLPLPFSYMVVDTNDPALPVLFASNRSRIGIDRLAEDLDSASAHIALKNARCLRDRPDCGRPPAAFTTRFEGVREHFVAQGLPGTPWVVLVHYSRDAIARPLAEAAVFAAAAWIGLAVVAALALLFVLTWGGVEAFQWSWPHPGQSANYRKTARRIALIGAGTTALCLALSLAPYDGPLVGGLRLILAISAPIGLVAMTIRALRNQGVDTASAHLSPDDEIGFRRLAVVLVLIIGVLPMLMFWVDSRKSSLAAVDHEQFAHVEAAIDANVAARQAIMRAFGTDAHSIARSKAEQPEAEQPEALPAGFGQYARAADDIDAPGHGVQQIVGPITDTLRRWSAYDAIQPAFDCAPPDGDSADAAEMARQAFCGLAQGTARPAARGETAKADAKPEPLTASPVSDIWLFDGAAFTMLLVGLVALLAAATFALLRSLFGHGVPLEAVNYPGIERDANGALVILDKTLILNAPLALQLELLRQHAPFDVSDPLAKAPDATRIVVVGLALALRDPGLRNTALVALEGLSRRVDGDRSTATPAGTRPAHSLIVMTDLSPLDRILQAFENEAAGAGGQSSDDGRREQLRWSRLFEGFSTIGFKPVDKVTPWKPGEDTQHYTDAQRAGIAKLITEVAALPEIVIDSLLSRSDRDISDHWQQKTSKGGFPFAPKLYTDFYDAAVQKWAEQVRPASAAAAVDYLRGTLIEHYQFAWIASSHAERVILYNLARGRTVNIARALALRSLVRRGLIRFAPTPRLINDSFAAFVLQAEKPARIDEWRGEQPDSPWSRSALALTIIIPSAIIALMALVLYSGERAIGLMPLLLGSAPALVGTLGAWRRSG
jgi:hypothetical protein